MRLKGMMMTFGCRVVVEVSGETDVVLGWLIGSDYETPVLPAVGDYLTLGVDALGRRLELVGEGEALPVLRRHFAIGGNAKWHPEARLILGARGTVDVARAMERDEWIPYSPAARGVRSQRLREGSHPRRRQRSLDVCPV